MMINEPFAAGTSFVHQIDPRIRVVAALLYSLVVAVATQFAALLFALGLSLILVGLAHIPLRRLLRRFIWVNGFILLLWVIVPLTFEGRALLHIGPLAVTAPGVILCARITLKSNAILFALIALVATMSIATLGHSLNQLRVSGKIVHLFLTAYRYVFVLEEEYLRLLRAIKIRAFKPKTSLHTYRTYAYLLGMIFVRADARAERVYQAMQCRGFKGRFYCLQPFAATPWNWVFSSVTTVMILIMAFLNWKELFR